MHLRKSSQLRHEVSIDEPLNVDWDGNELLLSDLLGSDPDTVNRDIEQEAERAMLPPGGGPALPQGADHHGAALWPGRPARSTPRRRWPTSWASPNPTSPGWRSASSTGCAGTWKRRAENPARKKAASPTQAMGREAASFWAKSGAPAAVHNGRGACER